MKKAFTLLELLTVIAIMAMMSTVAVGAYRGIVRGMEDRGVVATATLIVSAAQNRSKTDHAVTAVYFYNVLVQEGDDTVGAEKDYMIHGEAVAVRGSGRVTGTYGNYLFDEFNDLEQEYEVVSTDDPRLKTSGKSDQALGRQVVKLFNVTSEQAAMAGGKSMPCSQILMCAVVDPSIFLQDDFYFEKLQETDGSGEVRTIPKVAFKKMDNTIDWKVGDVYGFPFKETILPDGYVFGGKGYLPTSAKDPVKFVKAITFDPGDMDTKLKDVVPLAAVRSAKGMTVELRDLGTTSYYTGNL